MSGAIAGGDAELDMSGRRVLISGGSTGIGAAAARRLHRWGAEVALVARRSEPLDTLVSELGSERAHSFTCDLSDPDQLDGIVDRVTARMGGLDAVVSCAARADWMPFGDLDHSTFRAMMDLNVWAPLRLVQTARASLADAADPVVVLLGSVDGERPSPGAVAYGATKGAVRAATVALAKELAPDGIRVVEVDPGLVDTPMVADLRRELGEAQHRINLAGRFGRPEEVAGLIHYLVSPVGRFANGSVWRLDGGALTMGPFDATR